MMKTKNLLMSLIVAFSTMSVCAQDLLITAVFDGTLSGGNPRGLELYATDNIADLSLYGLGVAANGGGSDGQEYTFPNDAVNQGDYVYIVLSTAEFATYFPGLTADYTFSQLTINGDDPIELYFNGSVIDVYGDVALDGSGEPWEYENSYAYRLDGTSVSTTWNQSDWILPGAGAFNGAATNNDASAPMPIGTYSSSAGTILGCTNVSACNYNSNANSDDGSCELPGDACDDGDALTENDVLQGDCSCAGTAISTCDPLNWTVATVVTNSQGDEWIDNGDGTLEVNGFCGGGCAENIDTWIVSNGLDFSSVVSSELLFDLSESFGATILDLQYTASYSGDPSTSSWTSLGTFDAAGSFNVDLASIAGSSEIYFGFQYADDGADGYSGFTLSNINLTGDCPSDLTVFDCPTEMANFGDACDDGDASTNNDVIQNDCSCAGTPFVITNDLILTAVFDGSLSGGQPKGVEIYVVNDIADLSVFGLASITNGGGSPGQEFTFPADAAAAGDFIYVAANDADFTTFFGFTANYTSSVMGINGDDAIELYEQRTVIDTFGQIDTDGTGTPWEYQDGWAYRNCETGPDGTFVEANWSYSGVNGLEGNNVTDNASADVPMPVGSYETTCPTVVPGCTNIAACNYNENATTDDGSCELIGDSCDDGNNLTENDLLQNDCSCAGTAVTVCDPALVWNAVDVTTNSGSTGGSWEESTPGEYEVNGFCGSSCAEAVDTWLISNGYDFTSVTTSKLLFDIAENFGSTTLDLQYALDYAGDPTAATWVSLGTFDAAGAYNVDLAALAGVAQVHLGFQYADDGADGYSSFTLANVNTTGDCPSDLTVFDCPTEMANFGDECDDEDASTINDVIQNDCSCAGEAFTLTNDLIITAVFDGPLNGGTPKGVELYVVNDISDLSTFGLGSANNGDGTDGEEFAFPADAVTAGTFIYVSAGALTEFNTFFGFDADYDGGAAVSVNGDDALELFEFGQVIDTFGDINTDGSGETWDYLDGWAYRNCETGPDGATFVEANWTFSGVDALDGESDNATAINPVPVGSYLTTCAAPVLGCTDDTATNYNPLATQDDGSCTYDNGTGGCTHPLSYNFDPAATTDDGSCDPWCIGDLNGDRSIDINDFLIYQPVFGTSCPE